MTNQDEILVGKLSIAGEPIIINGAKAWGQLEGKPFSNIGSGLLTINDTLQVDTTLIATKDDIPTDANLEDYYNKTEIDNMLSNINLEVDLDDYYTKTEVDDAISNINLINYATKAYVQSYAQPLGDYLTETEVLTLIQRELGVIENGSY